MHIAKVRTAVGFIGVGNMGAPMARNLLKAGYDVIVHDPNPARLSAFPRHATTLGELTQSCARIVTMLPNNNVVEQVYLGTEGLVAQVEPTQTTLLDCSTVSPAVGRKIAEACHKRGVGFVDAPVSGGVKGAHEATLSFLVGGPAALIAAHQELLLKMGKKILPCGPVGAGQAAKLCNNLILAISMAALSEALHLGTQLHLDAKVLSTVINASSGRSWASETYNPVPGIMPNVPASHGYEGGFSAALMLKDLRLALKEATQVGVQLPTVETVLKQYENLQDEFGSKDFSIIYRAISSSKQ